MYTWCDKFSMGTNAINLARNMPFDTVAIAIPMHVHKKTVFGYDLEIQRLSFLQGSFASATNTTGSGRKCKGFVYVLQLIAGGTKRRWRWVMGMMKTISRLETNQTPAEAARRRYRIIEAI